MADYRTADDITLTDDWGQEYALRKIDSFSGLAGSNPAAVRFGVRDPRTGGIEWGDPIKFAAGSWEGVEDDLKGFNVWQLRNWTAAATATFSFRAFDR